MRWITWPTNTFCAAVAWHNHPPVRGTSPTVRNAIANLERVRELKRAAKEAATLEEHTQALARARRRADLAAARRHTTPAGAGEAGPASANGHHATSDIRPAREPDTSAAAQPSRMLVAQTGGRPSPATVRVPGKAWRLQRWIDTWVAMCTEGKLVLGPITDDQHARATYGVSARHLDNIRKAAVAGAIRQRAMELGVPLPTEYIDNPSRRLNGKSRVPA
jgi:hypothetical protein